MIRNNIFSGIVVSMSTCYFLIYELYRTEWSFFLSHEKLANYLFIILIILSLIIGTLSSIADYIEKNYCKTQDNFKNDLITLTSKLVRAKLDRFKNNSSILKRNANIFLKITHPRDQINLLLNESSRLIQKHFSLNDDEICITIMQIDNNTSKEKAFFDFSTQKAWKQTKAKTILQKSSAAKNCLDTGEPLFIVDKKKASKKGEYHLSKRDKKNNNGKGSVYCYPSFTKTPDGEKKYIISIVTYNKQIKLSGDKEEIDGIKVILNEICRRIDLELTLKSIKDWHKK